MVVVSPAVWKNQLSGECSGELSAARQICGRDSDRRDRRRSPLEGVAVSHAPPSAVLVVTVQLKVPVPPFPTCTICEVAAPPVLKEKLNPPGRLSKMRRCQRW